MTRSLRRWFAKLEPPVTSVLDLWRELLDSPAPCCQRRSVPFEWIWSSMEYPRDGLILEWAKGLDSRLSILWDALFSWRKI